MTLVNCIEDERPAKLSVSVSGLLIQIYPVGFDPPGNGKTWSISDPPEVNELISNVYSLSTSVTVNSSWSNVLDKFVVSPNAGVVPSNTIISPSANPSVLPAATSESERLNWAFPPDPPGCVAIPISLIADSGHLTSLITTKVCPILTMLGVVYPIPLICFFCWYEMLVIFP